MKDLLIDKEFNDMLIPLSDEEFSSLEEDVIKNGCLDAIKIWNNYIVDGHHRYKICRGHSIEYRTENMEFVSKDDAIIWALKNQLARRNLNNMQRAEVALRLESVVAERAKEKQKGGQGGVLLSQKSVEAKIDTQKSIAKAANVSHDTVHKVKTILKKAPEEIIKQVRKGDISINKAYELTKPVHVSHNSGENEWYTPSLIIDMARDVMGSIDCDPATTERVNNNVIKAKTYFTIDDDGLQQEWSGNVWLNPPYAQPLVDNFSATITEKYSKGEIKQACILVNNATETNWCQRMLDICSAVCFLRSRVKFIDINGDAKGAPLQGQVIIYFGNNVTKFISVFNDRGICFDRKR